MSEIIKPVITKEQANSIGNIRREGVMNDEDILRNHGIFAGADACLNELDFMTLAAALINDYEVEKTPEEKVREYYEEIIRDKEGAFDYEEQLSYENMSHAVRETLNRLGIKIEGVNA
ncbi:hypothetical protein MOF11_13020 [Bacillus haynesii]|uniref:hypothetical protein n=1 Tax=Bacillus haynesii TaxID=1925021 RepID=UPI00227DE7BB|nr:hypothetical protein [Bacillus haynesii]MCY9225947.1 hypothetical protein [Bacillus haynesii]